MDRRRAGWLALIVGLGIGSFYVPLAVGTYYGVPLIGFVAGLLLAIVVGLSMRFALDFPFGSSREELLDDLTGEDTAERTAKDLVLQEEPELRKPTKDPTAWDR
ncbi:MAG: hypothetical protein L3K00_02095 [Thermoplasmata archaeon]|nr:hypothetical protein [Thermoplasmata archaeon]MCI4361573.1 hypothetical protein [Thermoplasmata archaeon]